MQAFNFNLLSLLFIIALIPSENNTAISQSSIATANNQFAIDLVSDFPTKNTVVSPLSISTALAMTYAGARNETAEGFEKALHFRGDDGNFHTVYGEYLTTLNKNMQNIEWNMANRLWAQNGFAMKETFLDINKQDYNAPVEFVQFGDAAAKQINGWVEKETKNKIKELIPKGALTSDTRLVLVNAVYFKGDWEYQFEKSKTRKKDFKISEEEEVKVDMMYQEGGFNYNETSTYQALQLPYKSKDQSMVIFLPREGVSVKSLQKELTVAHLAPFRNFHPGTEVKIHLPKFKLEYKFSVNKFLKKAGMNTAFDTSADFSGISTSEPIWIDQVLHKAFIEVGEEGTEAAAATAVIMTTESTEPSPKPKPKVFKADHPFIFFIVDNKTGAVLFTGKVMNPLK